jgi:hypothetical protein
LLLEVVEQDLIEEVGQELVDLEKFVLLHKELFPLQSVLEVLEHLEQDLVVQLLELPVVLQFLQVVVNLFQVQVEEQVEVDKILHQFK